MKVDWISNWITTTKFSGRTQVLLSLNSVRFIKQQLLECYKLKTLKGVRTKLKKNSHEYYDSLLLNVEIY